MPEGADYYTAKDLVLADEYKTNPQYAFTNIKQDYFGHDMIAVSIMTEQDDRTQNIIELYDYEGTRLGSITAGDSIQFIECIGGDNNGLKALVEDYNNQVSIRTLNTQSVSLDRFCDVQFAKSLNSFEANRLFVLDTGFIISCFRQNEKLRPQRLYSVYFYFSQSRFACFGYVIFRKVNVEGRCPAAVPTFQRNCRAGFYVFHNPAVG